MNENRLMQVLLAPHISEKSANEEEQSNKYVFKVATDSNKAEIKGAIDECFSKVEESSLNNARLACQLLDIETTDVSISQKTATQ